MFHLEYLLIEVKVKVKFTLLDASGCVEEFGFEQVGDGVLHFVERVHFEERQKHKFLFFKIEKYKNIKLKSPYSQMRLIIHADLDCFYCQVEQVRLKLDSSQPIAVQQWQGLIAVNYAGMDFNDILF